MLSVLQAKFNWIATIKVFFISIIAVNLFLQSVWADNALLKDATAQIKPTHSKLTPSKTTPIKQKLTKKNIPRKLKKSLKRSRTAHRQLKHPAIHAHKSRIKRNASPHHYVSSKKSRKRFKHRKVSKRLPLRQTLPSIALPLTNASFTHKLNIRDTLNNKSLTKNKQLVSYIKKIIDSLRYTKYQYGGNKIDVSRGIYIVDCSRYVDYLLQIFYPHAYAKLVKWSQSDRPTTNDYYQYLSHIMNTRVNYWRYIDNAENLRAGDILVFRYTNRKGYETGGHIMIVIEAPSREGNILLVKVADSATGAHSQDTRSHSGIGIGSLLLKIDPKTYEPIAYAWSIGGKWQHQVNIAMGRLYHPEEHVLV